MIWVGTSGWIYPHWVGRFYPPKLPQRDYLAFYAQHFSTVEINSSFYRLPTYAQFQHWHEAVQAYPDFIFAVKASRYITHMKKLHDADEGVGRLISSAQGLGTQCGPLLYQLPPRWHANFQRLAQFIKSHPRAYNIAIEFRDASWLDQTALQTALQDLFSERELSLVVGVGGDLTTPLDFLQIGTFCYLRFHHGAHGIGFTEDELQFWSQRCIAEHARGREVYAYFNNDLDGHAIYDAQRFQQLSGNATMVPVR